MSGVFITVLCIDDVPEEASTEYEPTEVLQRKIEALAEILNCTEEEAERAFFERL